MFVFGVAPWPDGVAAWHIRPAAGAKGNRNSNATSRNNNNNTGSGQERSHGRKTNSSSSSSRGRSRSDALHSNANRNDGLFRKRYPGAGLRAERRKKSCCQLGQR